MGMMENKVATTIFYRVILGLYWGNVGMTVNQMEKSMGN